MTEKLRITATTVGTCTFEIDQQEYEEALRNDELEFLFDGHVSDMSEKTAYRTPDGKIHAYPSGIVIGDPFGEEEMIYAAKRHLSPMPFEPTISKAIKAVLKVIDPVPEDVSTIEDRDGDEWVRSSDDPMVWICAPHSTLRRTYRNIEELWGPITWEGRQ